MDEYGDLEGWQRPTSRFSRHTVFNLTRPEKSLALMAPLARAAGGYAARCAAGTKPITEDRAHPPKPVIHPVIFASAADPDYQKILAHIQAAQARLDEIKRFDMPGFKPRREYVRDMIRLRRPPGRARSRQGSGGCLCNRPGLLEIAVASAGPTLIRSSTLSPMTLDMEPLYLSAAPSKSKSFWASWASIASSIRKHPRPADDKRPQFRAWCHPQAFGGPQGNLGATLTFLMLQVALRARTHSPRPNPAPRRMGKRSIALSGLSLIPRLFPGRCPGL